MKYLAWTGVDQSINVMSSGRWAGLQRQGDASLARAGSGPAINIFRNRPVVAWMDAATGVLTMMNGLNGAPVATRADRLCRTGFGVRGVHRRDRRADRRLDRNQRRATAQRNEFDAGRVSAVRQGHASFRRSECRHQHFRAEPGLQARYRWDVAGHRLDRPSGRPGSRQPPEHHVLGRPFPPVRSQANRCVLSAARDWRSPGIRAPSTATCSAPGWTASRGSTLPSIMTCR